MAYVGEKHQLSLRGGLYFAVLFFQLFVEFHFREIGFQHEESENHEDENQQNTQHKDGFLVAILRHTLVNAMVQALHLVVEQG